MANVVIVYDSTKISVEFNDMEPIAKANKASFKRLAMLSVYYISNTDTEWLEVEMKGREKVWQISHNGANNTLPIDSVNGVVPASLDELYTLLTNII